MLTKWMEKKLDDNYRRMLQVILNKFWRQYPTTQQLYGHLPSITKTIKIRWTRHAGHWWRSRDEVISEYITYNNNNNLVDPSTWLSKGRVTSSNIHTAALCRYGMQPWGPAGSNGWWGGVREGQRYPCWWCDMMMMMKWQFSSCSQTSPVHKIPNLALNGLSWCHAKMKSPSYAAFHI